MTPTRLKHSRAVRWRDYLPLLFSLIAAGTFLAAVVALIVAANSLPNGWMWEH